MPVDRGLRHASPRHSQRGVITTEAAIISAVMLVVIFTAVQAWLFYAARNAAQSGAAACVERVRGDGQGTAAGRDSASSVISQSGALDSWSVDVTNGGTTVRCTVTGRAPTLGVLGLDQISQSATMTKERVTR